MPVTAALSPSSPMPAYVVADPALQDESAVGAEDVAPPRVDGSADEQPTATAGTVVARPTHEALGKVHEQIAAALVAANDGTRALAPDIQRELARLVGLLPHVAARGDSLLLDSVDLALSSLLGGSPNVVFARETRLNVAHRLGIYPSLRWALMSSPIPAVRVMTGLLIVLGLAMPLLAVTVFLLRAHIAHMNAASLDLDDFILFGIFGAAGSVVSIMVRVDEFNRWPPDPSILFFTGLFKPIIGFFFAIFVLLALNSGIVQIGIAAEQQEYFFMAIAFIAGFSERFARDVAMETESIFSGVAEHSDKPAPGAVSQPQKS